MLVELEGGCRVAGLRDGTPVHSGDLTIWNHFASTLSLRVLELHGRATLRNEDRDEVLFVLREERSIYLPAGQSLDLAGDLTVISALTPRLPTTQVPRYARDDGPQRTGDRWYVELIQAEVTQFIGGIPPGRAPDHFHLYEEVICILDGEGIMHAGASSTPVSAGSCIFLPIRQRHC